MKRRNNKQDIVLILVATFFYMACPMMTTPLIPGFAESLGGSGAIMGIIGGLMNVTAMICRPVLGNLADRKSKYKMSSLGAALTIIACISYALASNNVVLLAARICHGVGYASLSICMATWLAELLPRGKVGFGMGLYGMVNALSMAIMPAVGIQLYERIGYHAAFALAIGFSLLNGLLIQLISDKGEPVAQKASQPRHFALVDGNVVPIMLIILLFSMPYFATQSFLVTYVSAKHLSVSASLFFPIYAVMILVLRLGLKDYFDRLPFRTFLFVCAASATVSLVAMSLLNGYVTMVIGAIFMAGGYGIMFSVCQSTAILLGGPGKDALANSTFFIGTDLGMALGPVIGGLLYGHSDIGMFYPVLLLTVPLSLAIGFASRKTLAKAQENA
ncbi:MAG: MFS transporter [Peptococcaceae bacterium]|nr:MFS transporter [Peptococcaceae bacterium]